MLKNVLQNVESGQRPIRYKSNSRNYTLQAHQTIVRNHMKTHHRLLIVHGTGSGKTLSSAHIAKDYLDSQNPKRMVIFVTPKAVQAQFIKSVSTVLSNKGGVYFATYDNLTNFLHKVQIARHESFKKVVDNAMIIADEAHYITEKTEKARVFYDIFKYADKVVLMTGTPIINGKVDDLLPYAKILNPSQTITKADLSPNFEKYFKCKISLYKVPENSSNFPVLQKTERFNFPLNNTQIAKVETNRLKKYAQRSWAFNRSLYSWRVFSQQNEPKFIKFLDIFKNRPYKTIVFFKEYVTLEKFAKFLQKNKIFFRRVTGKEQHKNTIIAKDDPRKRVVYLLTSSAKEGLDFKGVRTVIFMDYPWVPSNYNQIVGRARRYNSHVNLPTDQRNVKVYELAYSHPSKKTLNMRSLNILNSKRNLITNMLARLTTVSIEKLNCQRVSSPKTPKYVPLSVVPQTVIKPKSPQNNFGLARLFRTRVSSVPKTVKEKEMKRLNINKLFTLRQKSPEFLPKRETFGTNVLFLGKRKRS